MHASPDTQPDTQPGTQPDTQPDLAEPDLAEPDPAPPEAGSLETAPPDAEPPDPGSAGRDERDTPSAEAPTAEATSARALLRDRNLQALFAVTLVAVSAISAVSPAFPLMAEALGVKASRIGLLITAYTLPGIVLPPLLGLFADRHGRKRVLVASLLLFGLAGGAAAFAGSFPLLLGLRFVQGIGGSALFALNVAIIGDLFRGEARTRSLGYNGTVVGVAAAAYPAIGGGLALLGWNYPFLIALLAVPVGGLLVWRLEAPEPRDRRGLGDTLREVGATVKSRRALGLLAISALSYFVLIGAFFTYLPLLLESSLGASAALIGALFSARALAFSLTSGLLGRLSRRLHPRQLIQISSGLAVLVLVALPFAGSVWWLLPPLLLYGLASGLYAPSSQTLLAELAPSEQRATIMSLNAAVKRLGQTLGPVVLGGVADALGLDAVFFVGAGVMTVALATAFVALAAPGRARGGAKPVPLTR